MNTRSWMLASLAVAAAIAGLKLACSEDGGSGQHPADASGGSAGSGSGGDGVGGGSGGVGGTAGAPPYDGGLWQPTGDPEWTSVPWVDCGAQYAKHPEHAVPPLLWKACEGGVPGCERLVVNWPHNFPPLKTLRNSGGGVYATASSTTFVLLLNTTYAGFITAAFDDANTPIAAWRGPDGCAPWHFEWSPKHVCLTFGGLPPLSVGLSPPNKPYDPPIKTFTSTPDVPVACNDNLLFVMDTANRHWVRDLETDQQNELGWPQSVAGQPRVHGDLALVPRRFGDGSGGTLIEGWLWQRPNTLTKLIDAAPEAVFDIRTDGVTLAWLQAATKTTDWAPADVWISPFGTTAASIQPKKIGSVPKATISPSDAAIGAGYYAVIEPRLTQAGVLPDSPDSRLHLFRVADGKHWIVPRIPDVAPSTKKPDWSEMVAGALLELNKSEVWWQGNSQYSHDEWTVVRQRLDALGPGD